MAEDTLDIADPLDPNDTAYAKEVQRQSAEETATRAQAWLRARREAYVRLFAGNAMVGDNAIVLSDLKSFCRGERTPWDPDPRIHALLTGRFEVYTRIRQHITMSFDELWELYNGGNEQ